MGLLQKDHFILGIFGANVSGALAATTVPERWDPSWENNVKIAQMADEAGIDFMLPVARWLGFGGETNWHGTSLETFTWAAGLAALTKRIYIAVTSHVTVHNPVAAAKMIATIDAITNGRVILNIVAGWNAREGLAMATGEPAPHEERYAYAEEWYRIVRKLWTATEPFDWDGKYWQLKEVISEPRPRRMPTVFNAAGSGEGKAFATRNADILFTVVHTLERLKQDVIDLKERAKENGREVEVLTTAYVVCRSTEKEAKDYVNYFVDQNADWECAKLLASEIVLGMKVWPAETQQQLVYALAAGHGSWPIVGNPRQVADGIIALKEAGVVGTTITFVNYLDEFPYFRDEVLPLLEEAGIRKPIHERS